MERPSAAARVGAIRAVVSSGIVDPAVHSDGSIFLIGDERVDRFTGQQAFDGLVGLLDVFVLAEPVEGVSTSDLWGPSLVHPSQYTYISPWVVRGEPCLAGSRVPSASVFALYRQRGLGPAEVADLYPGLSPVAIEDAYDLERHLRRVA